MNVRERIEAQESQLLSPHAARATESRGRRETEPPDPVRTCYMRDRDRIMHRAKAFRRLAHKTQVFVSPVDDHYRTRLSHTLDVAQIARTIARALRLNEDLTEAIALAHDLGHPPFGHAGEEGLGEVMATAVEGGSFHHALHSLRVVDQLERDGRGLNLTWEVRNGIVAHTKGRADLDQALTSQSATLEAEVVKVSDRIAYLNHDIDDAVRAGLLRLEELPGDALGRLGRTHGERIGTMVNDVIAASWDQPAIAMSEPVRSALDEIKEHLFDHVYLGDSAANAERDRIKQLVRALFEYFLEHPAEVPNRLQSLDLDFPADRARAVCDYIAGMTDRYAKHTYIEVFLPHDWRGAEGERN